MSITIKEYVGFDLSKSAKTTDPEPKGVSTMACKTTKKTTTSKPKAKKK